VPNSRLERPGSTPAQIRRWRLPTRPTKKGAAGADRRGDISVELDAIPAQHLRDLVRAAIEKHLPREQLEVLKVAERSERQWLVSLARIHGDD
jgi:hypothetical protein